jgi:EmrB/QacA subfamily drug resistance transporter
MVVLDISIVNVALPSIQTSLHLSANSLAWVINAYTLTFAGFLLFGGRAADLFGRKRVFLIGLTIFTAASLVGGFAQNGAELIGARALQGLGGAILAPTTLTLLVITFTEPKAQSRALGVWSATAASGGAFGSLLGGVLTDFFSWRWVLFVNVPIGILLFIGALYVLRESKGALHGFSSLDVPGTLTVTLGLTVLVYAIVNTDTHSWGSGQTLITLLIAAVLLATFVLIEAKSSQPLVPLRIFKLRALSAANVCAMFVGGSLFSMFYFTSLYEQHVLGYSPLKAGFTFLPGSLAIILGTLFSARSLAKLGARVLLIVGLLIAACGTALLSRITADGTYWQHVLPGMMLVSLGIGMAFVPLTVSATTGVPSDDAGLASGLINSSRQMGAAIGLAALVTIATTTTLAYAHGHAGSFGSPATLIAQSLTSGYSRAFLITIIFPLCGALAALLIPPDTGRAVQRDLQERTDEALAFEV